MKTKSEYTQQLNAVADKRDRLTTNKIWLFKFAFVAAAIVILFIYVMPTAFAGGGYSQKEIVVFYVAVSSAFFISAFSLIQGNLRKPRFVLTKLKIGKTKDKPARREKEDSFSFSFIPTGSGFQGF